MNDILRDDISCKTNKISFNISTAIQKERKNYTCTFLIAANNWSTRIKPGESRIEEVRPESIHGDHFDPGVSTTREAHSSRRRTWPALQKLSVLRYCPAGAVLSRFTRDPIPKTRRRLNRAPVRFSRPSPLCLAVHGARRDGRKRAGRVVKYMRARTGRGRERERGREGGSCSVISDLFYESERGKAVYPEQSSAAPMIHRNFHPRSPRCHCTPPRGTFIRVASSASLARDRFSFPSAAFARREKMRAALRAVRLSGRRKEAMFPLNPLKLVIPWNISHASK